MSNSKIMLISAVLFIGGNLLFNITNLQAETIPNIEVKETKINIPVSPVEDLMREHGVLSRILLVYEEILRRLDNNQDFPLAALSESTQIINNFIQNYHEKLEENHIFTRFRKAGKLIELVNTLEKQHNAGRKIINDIMIYEKLQNADDKSRLMESIKSFIHMYRPHKAREDTILFPAFRSIVIPEEYNELGEKFEDEEQRLFGENGFEGIVVKVEEIEKLLGIYELSKFTTPEKPTMSDNNQSFLIRAGKDNKK